MKCDSCGITIPEMPEDASYEELLCDQYYEMEQERLKDQERGRDDKSVFDS